MAADANIADIRLVQLASSLPPFVRALKLKRFMAATGRLLTVGFQAEIARSGIRLLREGCANWRHEAHAQALQPAHYRWYRSESVRQAN
jgi:hypothetical protein